MPDASTPIKKIELGTLTYDIDAKYLSGHTWGEIAGIEFSVVWSNTQWASSVAPSASELGQIPKNVRVYYNSGTTYATGALNEGDSKIIYLIYSPNLSATGQIDNYDEYAYTSSTGWERIGGTGGVDLSNYVTKNDYTSESALSADLNTSYAGEYSATGNATITYMEATSLDNKGSHSHAVNAVGDSATVVTGVGTTPISFSGAHSHQITGLNFNTSKALSATGNTIGESGSHSHAVNLGTTSKTVVTNMVTSVDACENHSHSVTTHGHGSNVSVTGFSAAAVNDIMCSPQVSTTGVLSWSIVNATKSITAAGAPSDSTINTSANGSHVHTLTGVTTEAISLVTSATLSDAGAHSHDFNVGSSFNAVTGLKPSSDTPTYTDIAASHNHLLDLAYATIDYVSSITLDPAGSHSHNITTTAMSTTGTAAVAIASHRHTVNAQHSHVVSLT